MLTDYDFNQNNLKKRKRGEGSTLLDADSMTAEIIDNSLGTRQKIQGKFQDVNSVCERMKVRIK